ncbi:tetratricopeptide repeat protein [Dactylosporangium darangshiense]|uniref:Tetratricopeptide repeat protein n=1 Tax=Dactylosporangium darangshiense TaxID=579108 RepID=A0ABP8DGA3_9ACTN
MEADPRSMVATTNSGIMNTGDNPRFIRIDAGSSLPAPFRVVGLPREPVVPFVGRDRDLALLEASALTRALYNLAYALDAMDRPDEALPLRRRALEVSEAALGPDHPIVAVRLHNLATTLLLLSRPTEARPLHERALRISESTLGPDHPTTVTISRNLAELELPE